jgi:hypothetical protein
MVQSTWSSKVRSSCSRSRRPAALGLKADKANERSRSAGSTSASTTGPDGQGGCAARVAEHHPIPSIGSPHPLPQALRYATIQRAGSGAVSAALFHQHAGLRTSAVLAISVRTGALRDSPKHSRRYVLAARRRTPALKLRPAMSRAPQANGRLVNRH